MRVAAAAFVLTLPLIAPVTGADAQTPEDVIPPQDFAARVDQLFAQWNRPDSPGCLVAVIRAGEIVFERAYGSANLEHDIPFTAQSVFSVASMSKQFTAMSVLLLARRGRLSLNDDIRKHQPEIPDYGEVITIRHLLHHTSGLRDYGDLIQLSELGYDDARSDTEILALITRQRRLNFTPGERHAYSNTGYFLLSRIVQQVSGQSLRGFAEENIFAPLGMTDTVFQDDRGMIIRNRVAGYMASGPDTFARWLTLSENVGAGGLMTTVEDLAKWDANFYVNVLDGGGPGLIEEWLTPGLLNDGSEVPYSLGVTVARYRGLKTVAHAGSLPGFQTELIRFPDQRTTVACLCNVDTVVAPAIARQVADVYLEALLDPPPEAASAANTEPVESSEADLASHAGFYFDADEMMGAIRVEFANGSLSMFGLPLVAVSAERFVVPGAPIAVEFPEPAPGAPAELVSFPPYGGPYRYQAMTPPTVNDDLADFAGDYWSDELGTTYSFSVSDAQSQLIVEWRGEAIALERASRELFFSPGRGAIEFTRDAEGRVTGMIMSTERARGFLFARIQDAVVP